MRLFRNYKFLLILSVLLMVLSAVVASLVQTSSGRVQLTDLRWEARPGMVLSALLYKPANASDQLPAPAIVLGHGWWGNREMQGPVAVELSRRGYVVIAVDLYGHGNSSFLNAANIELGGTGVYDAVRFVADLPYVDKTRIGVCGHSHGARAANLSIALDNESESPLIAAVMLVGNDPVYTNSVGTYTNSYGHRHVGVIADQYDEFYFRSYGPSHEVLTPPREYIHTANAQSFLHFGADPAHFSDERSAGQFYTDHDAVRIAYTPAETHPWSPISQTTIASQVAFFERTLGAPARIDARAQVWQIKETFTAIGLIGFALFLVFFPVWLLRTPLFAALATEALPTTTMPNLAGLAWVWSGLIFATAIFGGSYVVLGNLRWMQGIAFNAVPTIFRQGAVFAIAFWLLINGVTCIVIMTVSYLFFWRDHGLDLRATGVLPGWKKSIHGVALAFVVVAAAYGIVFALHFFFLTDFRFWLLAVRTFTLDKLWFALLYMPMLLVFFCSNSVAINCFYNRPLFGGKALDLAGLALFNVLAPVVIIAAQYITFFRTGYTISGFGSIFGIWLFPVVVYLAASVFISRKLYNATNNPYIGGFINAAVVTFISVANTLTVSV